MNFDWRIIKVMKQQYTGLQFTGTIAFISSIGLYIYLGIPILSFDFLVFLVVYFLSSYILIMLLPTLIIVTILGIYKAFNKNVSSLILENKIDRLNSNRLYKSFIGIYTIAVSILIVIVYSNMRS